MLLTVNRMMIVMTFLLYSLFFFSEGQVVASTVTGTGTAGYSGDNGPAIVAGINTPVDVEIDGSGNLYIADNGNGRIRKITDGTITTVAASLSYPRSIAIKDGNLYISESNNIIRRVDKNNGTITTFAGIPSAPYLGAYSGDNGPATSAQLNRPNGVAIDKDGNLYIADTKNHTIRKVDTNGIITTVAGRKLWVGGYGGDNGTATAASLNTPYGVAIDEDGNLYIADTLNHRIRKVDINGIITTVAGTGSNGTYSGDNEPATVAGINNPLDVEIDGSGNLYIADTKNHRIRKVDTNGIITTVAGTGIQGYNGDNGPATSIQLNSPSGIAIDGSGNLYIADTGNHRIRKVDTNGAITPVAGTSDTTLSCPQPVNEDVVAFNPTVSTGTGSIAITVLNDDKKTTITEPLQVKIIDKSGRFVTTTSDTISTTDGTFTSSDKLAKGTYYVTISNGTVDQTTEVKVSTKKVSVKLVWESNLQGLKDDRTGVIKRSGAIKGIVYDSTANTAKTVCGATVKVVSKKTTWSTKTNKNGSFNIYVPVGTYDVIVEGKDFIDLDDKKNIRYPKVKVTPGQASAPLLQLNAGLNWEADDKDLDFVLTEASLEGKDSKKASKAFTGKALANSIVSIYTVASGDRIWVVETKTKKNGNFSVKVPILAGEQVMFTVRDEAGNIYESDIKQVPKIDAPVLSASATKGTASGTTKITATKTKNTDNKILVIASTTATSTPKLGDLAPITSDSTIAFIDNYESKKEISAKGATYAAVYEVSATGTIVKFKDVPLTGKIKE